MTTPDIEHVAALIREVALEVVLPRWRRLTPEEVREKAPGDLVTDIDMAAEARLEDGLKALTPGVPVIGEERVAALPHLLDELPGLPHAWIVDPIDGTANYVRGQEAFAVMVSYVVGGRVAAAWVYLPAFDEMASAEAGSGAWINGGRVRPPELSDDPAEMVGSAHTGRLPPLLREAVRANLKRIKDNRPAFCAGFDYLALLHGRRHFTLYSRTLPWDHLPGALLVTEAGGKAARFDGEPFLDAAFKPGPGILSAMSDWVWRRAQEALFGPQQNND